MNRDEYFDALEMAKEGEYLEHYGVPGMKWGIRKAKKVANNPLRAAHLPGSILAPSAKGIYRRTMRRTNRAWKLGKRAAGRVAETGAYLYKTGKRDATRAYNRLSKDTAMIRNDIRTGAAAVKSGAKTAYATGKKAYNRTAKFVRNNPGLARGTGIGAGAGLLTATPMGAATGAGAGYIYDRIRKKRNKK